MTKTLRIHVYFNINWITFSLPVKIFGFMIQIVSRFGKTCIIYTFNFSTLVTYNTNLEYWIDVTFSGIVEILS